MIEFWLKIPSLVPKNKAVDDLINQLNDSTVPLTLPLAPLWGLSEISQHGLDALLWRLVQTFMYPLERGVITFVIPKLLPLTFTLRFRSVHCGFFPSCHKPVLTQYKLGFCWTVKRMHIKSPHRPVFISICPLRVSACPYCQAAIISCLADTEWRFWRVGPEEAALRATEPLTSKGVGFRSDQQLDVPPA